jgi:orotate phosphoribosyltransferase
VAALAEKGVKLHALATWWDALAAAENSGYLTPAQVEEVRSFLQDPESWSAAHGGKEAGSEDRASGV